MFYVIIKHRNEKGLYFFLIVRLGVEYMGEIIDRFLSLDNALQWMVLIVILILFIRGKKINTKWGSVTLGGNTTNDNGIIRRDVGNVMKMIKVYLTTAVDSYVSGAKSCYMKTFSEYMTERKLVNDETSEESAEDKYRTRDASAIFNIIVDSALNKYTKSKLYDMTFLNGFPFGVAVDRSNVRVRPGDLILTEVDQHQLSSLVDEKFNMIDGVTLYNIGEMWHAVIIAYAGELIDWEDFVSFYKSSSFYEQNRKHLGDFIKSINNQKYTLTRNFMEKNKDEFKDIETCHEYLDMKLKDMFTYYK